jgi:hypothetical protein
MKIAEIAESVTQVWSRKGSKLARKYRCTSGSRKGRIVSKPSTCTAPKNLKRSTALKKTRRIKASKIGIKTSRTKRTNPWSKKVRRLNRTSPRSRKRIR